MVRNGKPGGGGRRLVARRGTQIVVAGSSGRVLLVQLGLDVSHELVIRDADVGLNGLIWCDDLWLLFAFEVLAALLEDWLLVLGRVADHAFWA